jgi:tRNA(fMet)-specific endonuclease VapC
MTAKYLIDTDWIIHYLNGHAGIVERLEQLSSDGLAVSIVTLAELYEGVYYSRDPRANEQGLNRFLSGVTVLGVDEETCRLFGRERGRLRAARKRVGDFDLIIGLTARQHQLTLLTNNRRHFALIDGVVLESA